MTAPESLQSARLVLRKPRPADAPALFASYAQDERVTHYLRWRPHNELAESETIIERFLEKWTAETEFSWFLFTSSQVDLIGSIAARIEEHEVELGYALAQAFWGQGLMLEAITTVVDWVFEQPTFSRVRAICDVENKSSARLLEKAGFIREEILERWMIAPNISQAPRDCYFYAKVRSVG
jgi:ribosomal-protein-alanine N-acetyltransferase